MRGVTGTGGNGDAGGGGGGDTGTGVQGDPGCAVYGGAQGRGCRGTGVRRNGGVRGGARCVGVRKDGGARGATRPCEQGSGRTEIWGYAGNPGFVAYEGTRGPAPGAGCRRIRGALALGCVVYPGAT